MKMGLLQKAVETYDAMAHRAGKVFEKKTEPLAPVSHITTQAGIEITLDQDGNFISARAVIPAGRKNSPVPRGRVSFPSVAGAW